MRTRPCGTGPTTPRRHPKAAVAQYTSKDDGGVLVLSGMYGRLASPALARTKILEGAAESDGGTVVVPATEFRPDGSGAVAECQVVQYTDIDLEQAAVETLKVRAEIRQPIG
ncbi:hypothetical protein [Streptomyces sp. SM10]|uniref:hypothetical protein n=1 Tax=Streptomyces sp. SM10 TaxID=565556 RepID=UPI000CD54590|nr:hypothetical protein [Streptomyces sp. SM10]